MEQNKIELNRKHIGLRIAAFVIVLGVAATFISIGIVSLVSKKSGVHLISSEYDNNYECGFYLEGKSKEIAQSEERIKSNYTAIMKKNFSLLSNENKDESYFGISYLNKHLNEDIKIDKYAYDILLEAYNYSKTYGNYSIFASPIYEIWNELFNFKKTGLDYINNDPVNNNKKQELLSEISSSIFDTNKINIEFKEDNVIRVNVSEEYLSLLKDNDLDKSTISLNILYDSYASDKLYDSFKEEKYSKCYFKTSDSLFVIDYDDISLNVTNSKLDSFGTLKFNKDEEKKISMYRLFNTLSNDISSFYYIEKEGQGFNRTKFINISDGYPVNEIKQNIIVDDKNKSMVELSLINNELLVSNKDYDIIKMFSSSDNEINISKQLENVFVKANKNYQYNFF